MVDILKDPRHGLKRNFFPWFFFFWGNCYLHQDDAAALVTRLLDRMMKSEKYGERRGAAFGLAGVVKGFGISCLKKYRIVVVLQEGLADRWEMILLYML